MSAENKELETVAPIKVVETEKDWAIVGQFNEYDFGQMVDFFSNERNFLPAINFAKERVEKLVADPTTKDGQITRKALAKHIGQIEKAIADKGLEIARILKTKPNEIDKVRRKVKDTLLMYKDEVLAPLKEIESRQAEIVEMDNIPAQAIGCDSVNVKNLIEQLESKKRDKDYWKESWDDAQYSFNNSMNQLRDILAKVEKEESDRAELERLRKAEAERAAEIKEEAERKIAEAKEDERKAKEQAEESERKAKEAEENARKAQEAKEAAEAARDEAESKIPEWKKKEIPDDQLLFPQDRTEYRRKANREAMMAIAGIIANAPVAVVGAEEVAKAVVTAVVKGKVPHMNMEYEI